MKAFDTAYFRALGAGIAAAVVAVGTAACSGQAFPLPTASCALLPDLSESATSVVARSAPLLTDFVVDQGCASVQIVPITANSSGEECTVPAVDLLDLRAAVDNPAGRRSEIEAEKIPLLMQQVAALNTCVRQKGTGGATDVIGAFHQADRLTNHAPVVALVLSDLVHNADFDLLAAPISTDEQRTALAATVAQRLPDLSGWSVTIAGAAVGTSALTAEHSDAVQTVWEQAVGERGGSWHRVAV